MGDGPPPGCGLRPVPGRVSVGTSGFGRSPGPCYGGPSYFCIPGPVRNTGPVTEPVVLPRPVLLDSDRSGRTPFRSESVPQPRPDPSVVVETRCPPKGPGVRRRRRSLQDRYDVHPSVRAPATQMGHVCGPVTPHRRTRWGFGPGSYHAGRTSGNRRWFASPRRNLEGRVTLP